MALSVGIVGLPNVGKSTLFKTITRGEVDCENYPFCTIDPNVGVVAVPDERVDKLTTLSGSQKTLFATVDFVDIAGLVPGAHKGEGLGNKFLSHIRKVDAIVYVLRAFKNDRVINTSSSVDPVAEAEILDTELILKDLESTEHRLEKLKRDLKNAQNKEVAFENELIEKIKTALETGKKVSSLNFGETEEKVLRQYQFLTSKPVLYVLNGTKEETSEASKSLPSDSVVSIDIRDELESANMSPTERESLGLGAVSGVGEIIKKSYQLLGLITFLTTGTDETRAWQVAGGAKAPQAAGVIHTDFEKKFIRAEVVFWQDLLSAGNWATAREKGIVRSEGKNYIVKDGDVLDIKHG